MSKSRNEHDTAESWLREATNALRSDFEKIGYKLPEKIRFDFGFTSHGKKKTPHRGEFWDGTASSDEWCKAIIRCDSADMDQIVASLAHQLVHAAVGAEAGHGKPFRDCALRFGLEGAMRNSVPGPRLRERLHDLSEALGPFPHGALDFDKHGPDGKVRSVDRPEKQSTRALKSECLIEDCGYLMRISALHLRRAVPLCPVHMQPMWHEDLPAVEELPPPPEEAEPSALSVE